MSDIKIPEPSLVAEFYRGVAYHHDAVTTPLLKERDTALAERDALRAPLPPDKCKLGHPVACWTEHVYTPEEASYIDGRFTRRPGGHCVACRDVAAAEEAGYWEGCADFVDQVDKHEGRGALTRRDAARDKPLWELVATWRISSGVRGHIGSWAELCADELEAILNGRK